MHRVGGEQPREAMESLAAQWLLCEGPYQSCGLQQNKAAVPRVTVGTAVVMSRPFAATSNAPLTVTLFTFYIFINWQHGYQGKKSNEWKITSK